jgi:hypothetical protein
VDLSARGSPEGGGAQRSEEAPAAASARARPDAAPAPAPRTGGEARDAAARPRAKAAAPDARMRSEELRADAARTEVRTFEGCEAELRREVRLSPDGRVLGYVREGVIGGRRVRIEHAFGPDGALASVRALDLDRGEPLDPGTLGVAFPPHAGEAGADAPPRCR